MRGEKASTILCINTLTIDIKRQYGFISNFRQINKLIRHTYSRISDVYFWEIVLSYRVTEFLQKQHVQSRNADFTIVFDLLNLLANLKKQCQHWSKKKCQSTYPRTLARQQTYLHRPCCCPLPWLQILYSNCEVWVWALLKVLPLYSPHFSRVNGCA